MGENHVLQIFVVKMRTDVEECMNRLFGEQGCEDSWERKKLKRKIANLEDDMSSLLIENEKLRNIISGMQSYVKSYWGAEIKIIDQNGIIEIKE